MDEKSMASEYKQKYRQKKKVRPTNFFFPSFLFFHSFFFFFLQGPLPSQSPTPPGKTSGEANKDEGDKEMASTSVEEEKVSSEDFLVVEVSSSDEQGERNSDNREL